MGTILIILFGWGLGLKRGWEEAHYGAEMRIPDFFKPIVKFVSPLYLLGVFALFILFNVFGWAPQTGKFEPTTNVRDLIGPEASTVARLSVVVITITVIFFMILIATAGKRCQKAETAAKAETPKQT